MLKKFGRMIVEMLADNFDDRDRQIRYSWETECPDYVEPEDFVDYMAFGYAKVFTTINLGEREKICNWLAEDGIAIVDLRLVDGASDKSSLIAWLQGVAHMQQKTMQKLRPDLYLIGLVAVDEDVEALERIFKGCDRE